MAILRAPVQVFMLARHTKEMKNAQIFYIKGFRLMVTEVTSIKEISELQQHCLELDQPNA